MLTFKAITFFWPFLKEMILGESSMKDALKSHKGRVLLIGVILLSIVLNVFTIPRLIAISAAHVELQRKYAQALRDTGTELPQPPPSSSEPKGTPYEETKKFFEHLQEIEKQNK